MQIDGFIDKDKFRKPQPDRGISGLLPSDPEHDTEPIRRQGEEIPLLKRLWTTCWIY